MAKNFFQKAVEAPAAALGRTVDSSARLNKGIRNFLPLRKVGEYWHILGPGLTTGAADDDPSGIATYSQAGSQYGFQLLWLAAFTFPLMAMVQEMCARIGLVTGRGLASNIRHFYPKWVLYTCTILLVVANTFNIGADLGAMAKATQLLVPKASFGLLIVGYTVLILGLLIYSSYRKYARYLKILALVLLSYIFSAFLSHLDWHQVAIHSLVPSITFSKDQIFLVCGILGTTISPYLFFWQSSQEVEEQIAEGKTTLIQRRADTSDLEIKNMRTDVWSGMFLSNLVMFFIIAACAAILNSHGITTIGTAAEAAEALRPFAGDGAYILFTIGILGTGMLAIPVLAGSSSYAFSESFGWKSGLNFKLNKALAFYGIIIISMLLGLLMNFTGLDPIKALIYSAVANGIVAPVILVLIVLLSSNKKVMGNRKNSKLTTMFGWFITIVMAIAGIAAIISFFTA
jgi:NRAMP (natural resistance-associated macrophage protein)-like metal ion transporter